MIRIFTSVVNRPDFVDLQQKLFKKYLLEDYTFHVIDDSIKTSVSDEFKKVCGDNNIFYYKKPERQKSLNPAQACADTVQWTYDEIIKKDYKEDIVLFLDSDMFLIDNFNVTEYVNDCVIAGLPQYRGHVTYMWNGIMFFNMPKMTDLNINFSDGIVEGEMTDVGGNTYWYFKKNNVRMKETNVEYPTHYNDIELQNESVTKGYNFELHLDGNFLHYRAATNWHSNWRETQDPLELKTKIFNKIMETIISE